MNYRNKHLLEVCRHLACAICGKQDGTVVASHSNQQRDGKGMGIKAHDYRIASLCHTCHMEIDQGVFMDKQDRINAWDEAHRKTIGMLFESNHLVIKS